MQPIWSKLADQHTHLGVTFAVANIQNDQALREELNLIHAPSIVAVIDGKVSYHLPCYFVTVLISSLRIIFLPCRYRTSLVQTSQRKQSSASLFKPWLSQVPPAPPRFLACSVQRWALLSSPLSRATQAQTPFLPIGWKIVARGRFSSSRARSHRSASAWLLSARLISMLQPSLTREGDQSNLFSVDFTFMILRCVELFYHTLLNRMYS